MRTAAAFAGLVIVAVAIPFDGVVAVTAMAVGVGLCLWSIRGDRDEDDDVRTLRAAPGKRGEAPRAVP